MTADHKPLSDQERAIAKIVARDALWDAPADKVARNAYFFTDEHRARWLLAEAIPRYEATVAARDAVIAEQAERLRNLEQFRDEHFFVGEAIGSARQMITEQLGVTAGEVAIAQEGILAERLISPFFDDLIQAVVNRVKHIEARIADLEAEFAEVMAQRDASDAVVAASAWVVEINTPERWRNEAIERHRSKGMGPETKTPPPGR